MFGVLITVKPAIADRSFIHSASIGNFLFPAGKAALYALRLKMPFPFRLSIV